MTTKNLNDLLRMAEQAFKEKDRHSAGILIKQIIEQDFTNTDAWQFLHRLLGGNQSFDVFQQSFVQKYYPEKAHLLEPIVGRIFSEGNSRIPTHASQRSTKKCPYCAEIILLEAIACRYCGRELNQEMPGVLSAKRADLTSKLTELEKTLVSRERYLQEQSQLENEAQRQVTWAWIGIVLGLFLIPVFIGLILVPAGIMAAFTQSGKRTVARNNQAQARERIDILRKNIVEVRAALSVLQ